MRLSCWVSRRKPWKSESVPRGERGVLAAPWIGASRPAVVARQRCALRWMRETSRSVLNWRTPPAARAHALVHAREKEARVRRPRCRDRGETGGCATYQTQCFSLGRAVQEVPALRALVLIGACLEVAPQQAYSGQRWELAVVCAAVRSQVLNLSGAEHV